MIERILKAWSGGKLKTFTVKFDKKNNRIKPEDAVWMQNIIKRRRF